MILLVASDKAIKKKLCDMLHRERIIAVESRQYVLEALAQHQKKLRVIVASAQSVCEIFAQETIAKLCQKLSIDLPPIVAYWKNGDEKWVAQEIDDVALECTFIEYDEKDADFPSKYVKELKNAYPDLNIDMNDANKAWAKKEKDQDLVDIRGWLKEEGFVDAIQKGTVSNFEKGTRKKTSKEGVDYKNMYFEIKKKNAEIQKKYDELLKYFKELTDSI